MYKKPIIIAISLLVISATISYLIYLNERNYPKQLEKIESTNHVRTIEGVKFNRLTDDLDYGLTVVNIGDSISVLVYNGPSKSSMVVLNKPKNRELKDIDFPIHEDLYNEKHFDCYVEDIDEDFSGKHTYITECGIAFYSENQYKKGDILKNFTSPKHK